MGEERLQRRLAAILSADVVGYSRLMGLDEAGTLSRLNALRRELIDPTIAAHAGRIVKLMGDGALVEFASAVDAVTCAIEIQRQLRERDADGSEAEPIRFRIGINVGDIIIEGDDILGDGVNIAARIEGIAAPGGISLSEDAWRQVQGKLAADFVNTGEQKLKNISRPVQVWQWRTNASVPAKGAQVGAGARQILDKPSIAVLPFTNLSSDAEQDFFADGMTEDIITSLSKLRDILVIARNSSFTYKGVAVDVKKVGRELGVRYVLQGSVRRASNRLRITGRLIEAESGMQIWSDHWDCDLADIFESQDQITARIHHSVGGTLIRTEAARTPRAGHANIQAWQLRVQALDGFHRWDRDGCLRGVERGRQAIELDPEESDGYAVTAACLFAIASSGWTVRGRAAMSEVVELSSHAINLDAENAVAYSLLAVALLSFDRHDEAVLQARHGSELAPSGYSASVITGLVLGYCGEPHESLKWFEVAFRVSPRDPRIYSTYQSRCVPLFVLDRYEEVIRSSQRVIRQIPDWTEAHTFQAAAHARLGQMDEARGAIESLRRIDPQYSIKRALRRHPYRDAVDRDKLADALRRAGLT
jgi:adenylate cyclase